MLNGSEINFNDYLRFNSFYKKPEARATIFSIHKGLCSATGKPLTQIDWDIDHIVPQSEAAYFEELFPGLDVDNLINLNPLTASRNRALSNAFPKSPLMVYQAISYNIRLIQTQLPKLTTHHEPRKRTLDQLKGRTDKARALLQKIASAEYLASLNFGTRGRFPIVFIRDLTAFHRHGEHPPPLVIQLLKMVNGSIMFRENIRLR